MILKSAAHMGSIRVFLFSSACALAVLAMAAPAQAIPAFSRSEGQDCSYCHSAYPKLNDNGLVYKLNGFRFPGVEVTNVWDDTGGVPLSVVAEVEGFYDHTDKDRSTTPLTPSSHTGPDVKIDEIELFGAGSLGSRVSVFAELEFHDGANPGFGPVWVQVNDVVGPMGALNVRAGQFQVDLPFLSESRRVVRNKYLALDKMSFLDNELGLEFNGQVAGDQSKGGHTHRYAAGVIRGDENNNDNNKLLRGFGWYSNTWNEVNNLGVLVMGGQDVDGSAFPLLGDSVTLGRERGDVNFPDDGYVSGLHARLTTRDGNVYLSDLGSSNGTFIKINNQREVKDGSFMLLGQQLFKLVLRA